MNYKPVIGLEVHVQSKTASKMFCSCPTDYFGAAPNTHTCPVCLGLPGALPVPNKKAIELCIILALALNCKINKETKFDRKNYFYPDLSKGFQISQYDQPIGYDGYLDIELKDGSTKRIRIRRIHQEEDTGKSVHENGKTLLDFNKSGMPLVEIVTEPDFENEEQVNTFAKTLKQIVQYLDVSNADMEKGNMRFELNMSLRPEGQTELPNYKVEVKNIGSISVLEKVVKTETDRQSELLQNGETPKQETRGLVDMTGKTQSQRSKETEADYRYFPEPDIPPIVLSDEYLAELQSKVVELPFAKKARYVELGIAANVAGTIVSDVDLVKAFESIISDVTDKAIIREISNLFIGDYASLQREVIVSKDFNQKDLVVVASQILGRKITKDSGRQALEEAMRTGKSVESIIVDKGMTIVTDKGQLETVIATVMTENAKAIEDFKTGKNPNAVMFLVGQVMKAMKGQADAKEVEAMLREKLS